MNLQTETKPFTSSEPWTTAVAALSDAQLGVCFLDHHCSIANTLTTLQSLNVRYNYDTQFVRMRHENRTNFPKFSLPTFLIVDPAVPGRVVTCKI